MNLCVWIWMLLNFQPEQMTAWFTYSFGLVRCGSYDDKTLLMSVLFAAVSGNEWISEHSCWLRPCFVWGLCRAVVLFPRQQPAVPYSTTTFHSGTLLNKRKRSPFCTAESLQINSLAMYCPAKGNTMQRNFQNSENKSGISCKEKYCSATRRSKNPQTSNASPAVMSLRSTLNAKFYRERVPF